MRRNPTSVSKGTYVAVIRAISNVKNASVTSTRTLNLLMPLIFNAAFCKILAMNHILRVLVVAIIIPLAMFACKMNRAAISANDSSVDPAAAAIRIQPSPDAAPAGEVIEWILGSDVGQFGNNKTARLLSGAGDGSISGRSIVGGNARPFDCTLDLENGTYV